jgi:hypothetical protein
MGKWDKSGEKNGQLNREFWTKGEDKPTSYYFRRWFNPFMVASFGICNIIEN